MSAERDVVKEIIDYLELLKPKLRNIMMDMGFDKKYFNYKHLEYFLDAYTDQIVKIVNPQIEVDSEKLVGVLFEKET